MRRDIFGRCVENKVYEWTQKYIDLTKIHHCDNTPGQGGPSGLCNSLNTGQKLSELDWIYCGPCQSTLTDIVVQHDISFLRLEWTSNKNTGELTVSIRFWTMPLFILFLHLYLDTGRWSLNDNDTILFLFAVHPACIYCLAKISYLLCTNKRQSSNYTRLPIDINMREMMSHSSICRIIIS